MTEGEVLADTLDKTRKLTHFYLSHLKELNPEEPIVIGKEKLNSIYWMAAHLIWAEDYLALEMTGAPKTALPWVQHFSIKSSGELPSDRPSFADVLEEMKRVHRIAIEHVKHLSSDILDQENPVKFHFGDGNTTKRMMIQHCIRHEGTHTGQLSYIARIFGKKII
jgi:hypothetical protein